MAEDQFEGDGFSASILRTRTPVTFVYVEGDKRLEVPRHARKLTLLYYVLGNLGLTDRVEQIATAFWALRDEGHIDTIEISYRAGDPNETVLVRPSP
jgi:hypothetical protein